MAVLGEKAEMAALEGLAESVVLADRNKCPGAEVPEAKDLMALEGPTERGEHQARRVDQARLLWAIWIPNSYIL
jgi:hypothetical protein